MALNGTDVLLRAEYPIGTFVTIGSQRDCSIDESTSEIDISSKENREAEYLAGRYSSSIKCNALYVPSDSAMLALKSAIRNGTTIKVRKSESASEVEEATCIVTGKSDSFPDQGESVVSVDLRVTGPWTAV